MDSGVLRLDDLLDEAVYAAAWHYCLRLCGEHAAAEDLLQDSLTHALLRLKQIRDPAAFKGWLLSIVRTQYLQRYRRRVLEAGLAVNEDETGCPEGQVRAAMASLPPMQRELLELYYFDELSLAETATLLGLKSNTVKQRLLRARAALRRQLESQLTASELAAIL